MRTLVFVVIAINLVFEQLPAFASDPGVGWHLGTGRWIVEHREVPFIDPFLAGPARAWVCDQWLADVFFFALYRLGSWPMLYLFVSTLYFSIYFGVLLPFVERRTGTPAAATLAVFVAMKIGFLHLLLRPTVFGFLFFTIELFLLEPLSTEGASKRRLYWLPLLFAVWTNTHGSFVLGFVPLGIAGVRYLWALIRKREHGVLPLFILGMSVLTTLVNPNGIKLHVSVIVLANSKWFMHYFQEWLPIELTSFEGLVFLGLLMTAVVGTWHALRENRNAGRAGAEVLPDAALAAIFAILTFRSVRIAPYFGIASAVLVARGAHALPETRVFRVLFPSGIFARVTRAIGNHEKNNSWPKLQLLAGSLVLFALIGTFASTHTLGPPHDLYPYDAVAALQKLPPGDVLAGPDFGGFLTWNVWPADRALIDDRSTLLGEAFYKQYFTATATPDKLVTFGKSLGAKYILLPKTSPLFSAITDAGCNKLYEDHQALVCGID